jgi:hypothetical protein
MIIDERTINPIEVQTTGKAGHVFLHPPINAIPRKQTATDRGIGTVLINPPELKIVEGSRNIPPPIWKKTGRRIPSATVPATRS